MHKVKFRIGKSGDLEQELKQKYEEQLLYICKLYDPLEMDVGKAVHETRQSFKKCRALLRLMRDSLGYASYFRENRKLRDMHRSLSAVRDADVFCGLLKKLRATYPELEQAPWFESISDQAQSRYVKEREMLLAGKLIQQISERVFETAVNFRDYPLAGEGFELIEGGLHRIYRQGREMSANVFLPDADAQMIHSFRKRAKYLFYQLTYLRNIYKPMLKASSSSLEKLTDTLGNYHDLHIATCRIPGYVRGTANKRKLRSLLEKIEEEKLQLNKEARKLSEKLYAEKPDQFTGRLESYWKSYTRYMAENTEVKIFT